MKLFSAWRKYFVLGICGICGIGGIAAILYGATPARAELVIDITRGFVEPLPVAVTDFFGESPDETKVGADIAGVIAANLERSGLFRPIDKGAFIQDPNTLRAGPRFGDWRLINAQALISGSTQVQADGRLRVEFRLWDVFAELQMTGLAYFTTPTNWRRVAHIISDAIYKRLTGEEGYFGAKVAIDEGLFEAPNSPDAVFAIHITPLVSIGKVISRPGPILAAADVWNIRVIGKGGHASMPQDCLDPIPVACEIVQAMQTFVTRRISAFDPVVLTTTKIEA
ncbi:MAG: hypothetical protein IIC53_01620 [Proteobacteria bacterium]|nr:hypothetical protein [Pseudomonadota bacterium]